MTGARPARRGGETVVELLEASVADHLFGLPGSSSVPIFHGLQTSTSTFCPSLHEGAALAMADGYSRFRGPTGVLLYMLPGVATGLSNLYNAWRDESPLLLVVSQLTSRARTGQAHVGEADLDELLAPFTRYVRELSHREQLAEALHTARRHVAGPPTGPAAVVVPEDYLTQAIPPGTERPAHRSTQPVPDIGDLVDILAGADRPLFIVGGQLRRSGGSRAMELLAELLEIPVVYEPFWNDRLGVAPGHRCVAGQLTERSRLAQEADAVVAIGSRMFNEVHPRSDAWFPSARCVVHVNADPAKLDPSGISSWAQACDPAAFVDEVLAQVRSRSAVLGASKDARRNWLEIARQQRGEMRPGAFTELAGVLADTLDHSYLVDESVSASFPLVNALRGDHGDRYVSTTGGSLGWGPAAACGVALATGRAVTCALGDGAFFFGLQGMWPAVAERLPVSFVVIDNGGFGSTQWFEARYVSAHGDPSTAAVGGVGSDFRTTGPSVVDAARGMGVPARTVFAGDLTRALETASSGPRLFHVPVGPEAEAIAVRRGDHATRQRSTADPANA